MLPCDRLRLMDSGVDGWILGPASSGVGVVSRSCASRVSRIFQASALIWKISFTSTAAASNLSELKQLSYYLGQ